MHAFARGRPSGVSRGYLRDRAFRDRAIACWMSSLSSVTSDGGRACAHAPYVGPFKSGSSDKPATSASSVVGWCKPSNTHPSLLAPRVLVRMLSLCAPVLGRTTNHAAKSMLNPKKCSLLLSTAGLIRVHPHCSITTHHHFRSCCTHA